MKDELSRPAGPDQPEEVRVAQLAAMVRLGATLSLSGRQLYRLSMSTETGAVARCAIQLLHQCFNLRTELTVRRSVLHKTRNYLISVPSQPVIAEALVLMGVLTDELGLARGIEPGLVRDDSCAAAYLRGAFMISGSVSDPRSDAHFEMVVQSAPVCDGLMGLLARFGVEARVRRRRGDLMIYHKSSPAVEAFLRVVGATSCAEDYARARQVKSLRNGTNRLVNAELANQKKTSGAAAGQVLLIRQIDDAVGVDSLPEALAQFCRLRLDNPELSLRELGQAADPALSKSAVGHRLRRLEELGAQLGLPRAPGDVPSR